MKKLIKKLVVVLTLVVTVMSSTSSVFAWGDTCPNCGSNDTRAPRINTDTWVRTCPTSPVKADHVYTYAQYEGIFCNDCSYQKVGKYLGTNLVAHCFNDGQDYYVIKGATHAAGYDFHECYDYWKSYSKN